MRHSRLMLQQPDRCWEPPLPAAPGDSRLLCFIPFSRGVRVYGRLSKLSTHVSEIAS